MSIRRRDAWGFAGAVLALSSIGGCAVSDSRPPRTIAWAKAPAEGERRQPVRPAVVPASYEPDGTEPASPAADLPEPLAPAEIISASPDDGLFAAGELDADSLVTLVEARNPSLRAMYDAWQAASARYPQDVALDDPMLNVMWAPASFARDSAVTESWSIEASQKFYWPGKRWLRGDIAAENADASAWDAEETRLAVALAARLAFADYVMAAQSLGLADDERKLLTELQAIAQIKYETNQAPQQDVLQANVELADIRRRQLEWTKSKRIAAARINTLLHRQPSAPLPPPKASPLAHHIPDSDELVGTALQNRPELSAKAARIAAEEAAYCLAIREFYPDFEIYGRYDEYWLDFEQRASIGVKINLPIRRDKRRAAVDEALAKIRRAEAELDAKIDQIGYEVTAAADELREAHEVSQLFSDEIIKTAEQNVASARAGYEAGTVNFLTLLNAQRQLIEYRQKELEVTVDHQRHRAELERAVGTPGDSGR